MRVRLLAAVLWLAAALYAGSTLHEIAGLHELVGPAIGGLTAVLVVADPFHRFARRPHLALVGSEAEEPRELPKAA